ncbi:MAG: hypothetical protein L3K13_01570 [Thermoplasmata archaeon]|nr:hypothetical protein [Thermoplasmata archaeon]
MNQSEPGRASRFASQFLQEQTGGPLSHAPLHERPLALRPIRYLPTTGDSDR